MSFEKPSNNEEMPFVMNAPLDVECQFEFKGASIDKVKTGGPKGDWSCYDVKVKNVIDAKGNEIVGTGEIPFWCMEPFYDAFIQYASDKGWTSASFTVTKDKDGNRSAEFASEDE